MLSNNIDCDFAGWAGESQSSMFHGAHNILFDVTRAYDKAHRKIDKMRSNKKTERHKSYKKNLKKGRKEDKAIWATMLAEHAE